MYVSQIHENAIWENMVEEKLKLASSNSDMILGCCKCLKMSKDNFQRLPLSLAMPFCVSYGKVLRTIIFGQFTQLSLKLNSAIMTFK